MPESFLSARWENIIMANYEVDAAVLKPFIPKAVGLDDHQGKLYVSLVGFMFRKTKLFNIPIPLLGNFEEINLRFYVKREDKGEIKRGVVFINETVPYKPVAWLANKLYKEHYTTVPAKSTIINTTSAQTIRYEWKKDKKWNHIAVNAALENEAMKAGSMEEFIFEHYYGYTRISDTVSQEYKVEHPRWEINQVLDHDISCDFGVMYGREFAFLNNSKPFSVFMAAGSPVTVKWKRDRF